MQPYREHATCASPTSRHKRTHTLHTWHALAVALHITCIVGHSHVCSSCVHSVAACVCVSVCRVWCMSCCMHVAMRARSVSGCRTRLIHTGGGGDDGLLTGTWNIGCADPITQVHCALLCCTDVLYETRRMDGCVDGRVVWTLWMCECCA